MKSVQVSGVAIDLVKIGDAAYVTLSRPPRGRVHVTGSEGVQIAKELLRMHQGKQVKIQVLYGEPVKLFWNEHNQLVLEQRGNGRNPRIIMSPEIAQAVAISILNDFEALLPPMPNSQILYLLNKLKREVERGQASEAES